MATFHLRLEEASKHAFDGPPDPVALHDPALNNNLTVRQDVNIDPNAVLNDDLCFAVSVGVFQTF